MFRYFLVTLGWRPDPVIATFARHRVEHGDKLILLVPEFMDERSREAIDRVRDHIRVANLHVDVELLELPTDFDRAVRMVLEKIEWCSERGDVIINISGGMRYIILATYTAFLLSRRKNVVLDELAVEGKNITISLGIPPLVRFVPDDKEREILRILLVREADADEIAEELGIGKSTAWRYLKRFEDMGIVDVKKVGKKKLYRAKIWLI